MKNSELISKFNDFLHYKIRNIIVERCYIKDNYVFADIRASVFKDADSDFSFLNSFNANITYFEVRTDESDSEVYILIGLKKTIKEAIVLV